MFIKATAVDGVYSCFFMEAKGEDKSSRCYDRNIRAWFGWTGRLGCDLMKCGGSSHSSWEGA